jgi:trans-2,3-dihydro-3-hydroxyanthranilate isomerase
MPTLDFMHVDVFSDLPFSGNSLAVFYDAGELASQAMLRITQELRHFETIFLKPTDTPGVVSARVFDLIEELPFAGHPILGAAAVLHHRSGAQAAQAWLFDLSGRTVSVEVDPHAGGFFATLDQGLPELLGEIEDRARIAQAFGLQSADLRPELPLEIVSTGLRYAIIPVVSSAIGKAQIASDIAPLVRSVGAQFAVLFDPASMEIRHWNNDGIVEDVATGSAAGTIAAYCVKHGIVARGVRADLSQGRFAGRPSRLTIWVEAEASAKAGHVMVAGPVALVGEGRLYSAPVPLDA